MKLEQAIRDTIEYGANFGSGVSKKEIGERLISPKQFSEEAIKGILEDLNYKGKKNNYYEEKLDKAIDLSDKIKVRFKEILFFGISGSVASGHPKKNDDIDILIITEANKLWQTRLRLRWWIYKNKIPHRKYGRKPKKNEFCFNLWLDENYIRLPKNKQNLKNSVDLVLLKPLINQNHIYEKFLLVNDWAKKWVATPYLNKIQDIRSKISDKKVEQNNFDRVINWLYFWPQYWYMRKRIKKEKIGLYQAFFHQ